jgi:hypothetical protein
LSQKFRIAANFPRNVERQERVFKKTLRLQEETMADREVIETNDGGGMGAILGMILGILIVGGLIFFFTGNWGNSGGSRVTTNAPSAPATTGSTNPSR